MMHVKIAKVDYTHPRFTNPDVAKDDWPGMAREATAALWRRKDSYPNLVANGKMDKAEAEADIAAWQEIANDWDWICTGTGKHADKGTLTARIEALDLAIFRFLQLFDRNHGRANPEQLYQGAMLAAMRWWAQREANGDWRHHARFNASVGHTWRAENGHPPPSHPNCTATPQSNPTKSWTKSCATSLAKPYATPSWGPDQPALPRSKPERPSPA